MITDLFELVDRKHQQLQLERSKLEAEELEIQKVLARQALLKDISTTVNSIAESIQQKVHEHIAQVVARCLRTVFGDDAYDFRILFERKRGKTEARMVFLRGGQELDPLTASGGGVVDVAAFGLRLACLVLSKSSRRILFLDEPFRFVSLNYSQNLVNLLEQLSVDLGCQILMVTHSTELETGKVVELGQ